MKGFAIRQAGTADAVQLAMIHQTAFAKGWSAKEMASLLGNGATGWLASQAGAPAGFVLVRQAADEAEILSLAVLPAARRKGLGLALVGTACTALKAAGVKQLFLDVRESNAAARHLYARAGFVCCARRPAYYADNMAACVYRRALS